MTSVIQYTQHVIRKLGVVCFLAFPACLSTGSHLEVGRYDDDDDDDASQTDHCRMSRKGKPCKCSVPHPNQIVAKLLHRVGGRPRLDRLRVVGDEDGLLGFDDDDALPALNDR